MDSEFLLHVLLEELAPVNIEIKMAGSTSKHFNVKQLRALEVIAPPLSLQKEFAIRVSEIRELKTKQTASRERLDDLFQSMLHRAFNGEL
jgi:type I restriction enzyme S subunit